MITPSKEPWESIFSETERILRWSHFKNMTPAETMLIHMIDKLFPHFKKVVLNSGALAKYMKDAQWMIQKPNLLVSAVNMIDKLPLTEVDTRGASPER